MTKLVHKYVIHLPFFSFCIRLSETGRIQIIDTASAVPVIIYQNSDRVIRHLSGDVAKSSVLFCQHIPRTAECVVHGSECVLFPFILSRFVDATLFGFHFDGPYIEILFPFFVRRCTEKNISIMFSIVAELLHIRFCVSVAEYQQVNFFFGCAVIHELGGFELRGPFLSVHNGRIIRIDHNGEHLMEDHLLIAPRNCQLHFVLWKGNTDSFVESFHCAGKRFIRGMPFVEYGRVSVRIDRCAALHVEHAQHILTVVQIIQQL